MDTGALIRWKRSARDVSSSHFVLHSNGRIEFSTDGWYVVTPSVRYSSQAQRRDPFMIEVSDAGDVCRYWRSTKEYHVELEATKFVLSCCVWLFTPQKGHAMAAKCTIWTELESATLSIVPFVSNLSCEADQVLLITNWKHPWISCSRSPARLTKSSIVECSTSTSSVKRWSPELDADNGLASMLMFANALSLNWKFATRGDALFLKLTEESSHRGGLERQNHQCRVRSNYYFAANPHLKLLVRLHKNHA